MRKYCWHCTCGSWFIWCIKSGSSGRFTILSGVICESKSMCCAPFPTSTHFATTLLCGKMRGRKLSLRLKFYDLPRFSWCVITIAIKLAIYSRTKRDLSFYSKYSLFAGLLQYLLLDYWYFKGFWMAWTINSLKLILRCFVFRFYSKGTEFLQ